MTTDAPEFDPEEVTRVAQAIAEDIGDWYEAGTDTYDSMARAAIKAMRACPPAADNRRFNKPSR